MTLLSWAITGYGVVAFLTAARIGWNCADDLQNDDAALACFAVLVPVFWPVALTTFVALVVRQRSRQRRLGMEE